MDIPVTKLWILSLLCLSPSTIIHSHAFRLNLPSCHHRHHNACCDQSFSIRHNANKQNQRRWYRMSIKSSRSVTSRTLSQSSESDSGGNTNEAATADQDERIPNDLELDIIRGRGDELSDDTWREIEEGAPTKVEIMKGVSSYCYGVVLAVGIASFHACYLHCMTHAL